MASTQTIIINGRHYDTQSGLPVDAPAEEAPQIRQTTGMGSIDIHASLQKSQTLNRQFIQRQPQQQPVKKLVPRPTNGPKHMDISRSSSISRFASHPKVQSVAEPDMITPAIHPNVQKAHYAATMKKQSTQAVSTPSKVLKNQAIAKALATPAKVQPKAPKNRFSRLASVSSTGLAVLLLAGYLTYLNMPTILIRVAAVQSGINASYPDYRPSGYRLDGPIAYNDGKVSMRFAANAGPQSFSIKEQRSSWNSSAVLENYVQPKAGSDYVTHTQSGLTIYTFDGKAAWVNGGILYTVDGDAPLSNDQILRIATSL